MYTHKCIGTNNSGYFEVHYSSPKINYVPQVKHQILSQGLRQPDRWYLASMQWSPSRCQKYRVGADGNCFNLRRLGRVISFSLSSGTNSQASLIADKVI